MNEKLDPKEAKILADILALTLDEQPGASMTALQKIQQRARQDGITGGALKNIFTRVASDMPRGGSGESAGSAFNSTQLRSTIAAQGASISLLEQRVALLQARLSQAEASRRQERSDMAGVARRLAIKTALVGLLIGVGLTALVAYYLPATQSGFGGQAAGATVATAHAAPTAESAITPPTHDPTDTAPGPEYPPEAAKRGQEGVVQLLVFVDKEGHVGGIGVSHGSGVPELDVAAEQAVRQWRFRPAMRDGVPIAVSTTVTMRFVSHH
jgi:TonB family protein